MKKPPKQAGAPTPSLFRLAPTTFRLAFAVVCLALCGPSAKALTPATLKLTFSHGTPSLTIAGTSGSTWSVQYAASLSPSTVWLVLTNITLTGSQAALPDTSSPFSGQRFYRAVFVPLLTNAVAASLAWIPPGTFVMGSPTTEVGRNTDETQRTVALTQSLYMSPHLVTQDEYVAVMGNNPSYFNGVRGNNDYGTDLSRPVEQVSWYAASEYCAQLTLSQQQAGLIPTNWLYRLPTESEWEYACRAGSTNEFSYGEDPTYTNLVNYAWYLVNSGDTSQDVATLLPNAFGLYDMEGDVFEWCQDWYGPYPAGPVANPQGSGPGDEPERVFRGGSWDYGAVDCRCAGRYSADPTSNYSFLGFRVVLAPAL